MCRARLVATLANAYSEKVWPDDAKGMARYGAETVTSLLDDASYMTHKYFDSKAVNAALKLPDGAGAFAAYKFRDDSILYLTCDGRLAVGDAGESEIAAWVDRQAETEGCSPLV
jgi:hypothetical protein